jgi:hypothetical protein
MASNFRSPWLANYNISLTISMGSLRQLAQTNWPCRCSPTSAETSRPHLGQAFVSFLGVSLRPAKSAFFRHCAHWYTVTVTVDGRLVFKGNPTTNPVLGLAKHVPAWAASSSPVLRVTIRSPKVDWTETVDLNKGKAIGLAVINGKIVVRQANGFGYD